jgi:hypothetical protein
MSGSAIVDKPAAPGTRKFPGARESVEWLACGTSSQTAFRNNFASAFSSPTMFFARHWDGRP